MAAEHLPILAGCLAAGALGGWAVWFAARRLAGEEAPELLSRRRVGILTAGAAAALSGWAWAATPAGPVLLASLILALALALLVAVDVSVFRLPDLVTLPLTAVGLLVAWLLPAADGLVDHVAGSIAGYGVLALVAWGFRRFRGREGLGMGDAKLMAVAGAWLGWEALPGVLLLGCLGGLLWWSLARILDRRPDRDPRIPFGAPLCAAIWLGWLYGPLQLPG